MVSLSSCSIRSFVSRNYMTESDTHFPAVCAFAIDARNLAKNRVRLVACRGIGGGSGLGFLGTRETRKKRSCSWCCGFLRRCNISKDRDSEGSVELEAEILEFMKNSEKPEVFPSKKNLIDAGRLDLVEGIKKQNGWLAMGWDLDDDGEEQEEEEDKWIHENETVRVRDLNMEKNFDNGGFQINGVWNSSVSDFSVDSSASMASSSGRSLEAAVESDSGIEGILNRLERERNMNLGFRLRERGNSNGALSNGRKNTSLNRSPLNSVLNSTVGGDLQDRIEPVLNRRRNPLEHSEGLLLEKTFLSRDSPKQETWRTWSMRRAGFSDMNFEAAEISSGDFGGGNKDDALADNTVEKNNGYGKFFNRRNESNSSHDEFNYTHIKSRLQHLQSELSSILHSLRSQTNEAVPIKDHQNDLDDLEELSDAWEFQENEIMSFQNKLRSTRAKLAVLEGKMSLAIIDARKVVEEKQKRMDNAHRALRILRTACIVWPNSASEVHLAGSFDGWVTQRKMEKSKNGMFSLWLKLYPGKYEIKFIVDGQWKIDPLRPTVSHDGYENNLLIIT